MRQQPRRAAEKESSGTHWAINTTCPRCHSSIKHSIVIKMTSSAATNPGGLYCKITKFMSCWYSKRSMIWQHTRNWHCTCTATVKFPRVQLVDMNYELKFHGAILYLKIRNVMLKEMAVEFVFRWVSHSVMSCKGGHLFHFRTTTLAKKNFVQSGLICLHKFCAVISCSRRVIDH